MYGNTVPSTFTTVTPFWGIAEGIYLLKRPSTYPLIEHYGVLITAGVAARLGYNRPIVVQQTLPQARIDYAEDTGPWGIVEQVPVWEISAALDRLMIAFEDPNYYLFANNCEQFARFIVSGRKASTQLAGFAVAGLFVAAVVLGRSDS